MRALLLLLLAPAPPFPVSISVDAARTGAPVSTAWAYFGYDEPNYTYMKDGKKLLGQLADLSPVPVYVRAHNLLTSGDGTAALKWGSTNAYTEAPDGTPRYDWTIIDRIMDTYVERGMKPLVEIGFMPEALSTKPQPYRHSFSLETSNRSIDGGWAYPPKDYAKWSELVFRWVKHSVERYGAKEVDSWLWELWNEPNIMYWKGTPEEFYKLYDTTAAAVKRALPTARIGGPHWAGGPQEKSVQWFRGFLEHVIKAGTPLDFVAFHAKGSPSVVDGHVRMGMSRHLQVVQTAFEVIASYPELKGKPVIIGESDPEGCAACSARVYPQNAYRNGTVYSSYTAASFPKKYDLAAKYGINLAGIVTWAFEFEDQPWFDGFRDLATNGVEKPVLNVFRMFGLMQGRVAATEVTKSQADVGALASRDADRVSVLVWHYDEDDVAGPDADVTLDVKGLPGGAGPWLVNHYRIDQEHSNSYSVWKGMGSPQKPTAEQIAALERAAQLTPMGSPEWKKGKDGALSLRFRLPRQGVSLLVFSGR
jgi:xylan 1,4-beta-xylosidase